MSDSRRPAAAQEVMREAIDRALAQPTLTKTDLRVFMALNALIAHFDRTCDRVATLQLVQRTSLDERHVRRSLAHLHELGTITRTPGHGRTAPHIDLRSRAEAARAECAHLRLNSRAEAAHQGGRVSTDRRADLDTQPGAYAPASEVFSEVFSEEGALELALTNLRDPARKPRGNPSADLVAELREGISRLSQERGEPLVLRVIREVGPFDWPSDLLAKVETATETFEERKARTATTRCPTCNGCGQYRPDNADPDTADVPCPDCELGRQRAAS